MNNLEHMIKNNWERVNEAILNTADSAGLPMPRVVVVTKKQPTSVLHAVISAGARILGENYPEEAVEKMDQLIGCAVDWHMIGHIQSRKSALIAERFDLVHSVDRQKVAKKLHETSSAFGKTMPILLECNVSGEASKSGYPAWADNQLDALLEEVVIIHQLSGLRVVGLMTMPPFDENAENCRPYFQRLSWLREYINKQIGMEMTELSMGTSFDHLVAVQEGATFVRIGTAITGERVY